MIAYKCCDFFRWWSKFSTERIQKLRRETRSLVNNINGQLRYRCNVSWCLLEYEYTMTREDVCKHSNLRHENLIWIETSPANIWNSQRSAECKDHRGNDLLSTSTIGESSTRILPESCDTTEHSCEQAHHELGFPLVVLTAVIVGDRLLRRRLVGRFLVGIGRTIHLVVIFVGERDVNVLRGGIFIVGLVVCLHADVAVVHCCVSSSSSIRAASSSINDDDGASCPRRRRRCRSQRRRYCCKHSECHTNSCSISCRARRRQQHELTKLAREEDIDDDLAGGNARGFEREMQEDLVDTGIEEMRST